MNFLIRVDSNKLIGTGHLMRSIALGQILQDGGNNVNFITKTKNIQLLNKIKAENFNLIKLNENLNIYKDADETIKSGELINADWIITDGYKFKTAYQKKIKKAGFKLMCIDDIAKCHYVSDIVLNQNYKSEKVMKYSVEKYTKLLLGANYLLLRREFRHIICNRNKQKNILIFLGGADKYNLTQKIIEILDVYKNHKLNIDILIGAENKNKIKFKNLSHQYNIYKNVDNITNILRNVKIGIVSAGSIVWELLYMNITPILIKTAYNQNIIVKELIKDNVALGGWNYNFLTAKKIHNVLNLLLYKKIKTKKIILDIFKPSFLINIKPKFNGNYFLKEATIKDMDLLYEWANDEETRRNSFNQSKINYNEHKKWFRKKLKDKNNSRIFIFYSEDNKRIGQIRFDKEEETCNIDYYIIKEERGKGLGKYIVQKGIESILNIWKEITTIKAEVKKGNINSDKVFQRLNFEMYTFEDKNVYKRYFY